MSGGGGVITHQNIVFSAAFSSGFRVFLRFPMCYSPPPLFPSSFFSCSPSSSSFSFSFSSSSSSFLNSSSFLLSFLLLSSSPSSSSSSKEGARQRCVAYQRAHVAHQGASLELTAQMWHGFGRIAHEQVERDVLGPKLLLHALEAFMTTTTMDGGGGGGGFF